MKTTKKVEGNHGYRDKSNLDNTGKTIARRPMGGHKNMPIKPIIRDNHLPDILVSIS